MKDDYPNPWDIYDDLEKSRLEEVRKRDATHKVRTESNEQHEETVRSEESQTSILRFDQQEEAGVKEVAPVKRRKRGRSHGKKRRTKAEEGKKAQEFPQGQHQKAEGNEGFPGRVADVRTDPL